MVCQKLNHVDDFNTVLKQQILEKMNDVMDQLIVYPIIKIFDCRGGCRVNDSENLFSCVFDDLSCVCIHENTNFNFGGMSLSDATIFIFGLSETQ